LSLDNFLKNHKVVYLCHASPKALQAHADDMHALSMATLFANDPERAERYHIELGEIYLDYAKHLTTPQTWRHLFALAEQVKLEEWRQKLFAGQAINHTEGRAVMHMALRRPIEAGPVLIEGADIMPKIHAVRAQMARFSDAVRTGQWQGATGLAMKRVVNIGIGGSDLGPAMVCQALSPYSNPALRVDFVSNVDGCHLSDILVGCDPATTLFIIASKTFTTQETMANAYAARRWLVNALGEGAVGQHFVALSTNLNAVKAFGIQHEATFAFWDWVGGRYSLWSAIGLSIALAIGFDLFEALLAGAYAVDQHFETAPMDQNAPIILGLLGVWYHSFLKAPAHAVLPYHQHLARLPAYLQQADMESNGKSVDREGNLVDYPTGPIIFGEAGTNGQHSFYQLLHQGTHLIPCDFIAAVNSPSRLPPTPLGEHHQLLLANMLAQAAALMRGKTAQEAGEELARQALSPQAQARLLPYKVFAGNHPSTSILLRRLTPFTLGQLLALYEHKIFVQGILWNLNSYDQWGVELGKQMAAPLASALAGKTGILQGFDDSTRRLIARCHAWREG
jgi:glucose-6-phosphate isomerase